LKPGGKSRDEPETVVTALIAATLDHSTPRTLSEPELREETPQPRVEEPQEPSSEIATGVTSPLTKTTVLEKEVLETMARIQIQMREQPDLLWMSAKAKAEEEPKWLRKERDDLKKEASRPTQTLEEEVEHHNSLISCRKSRCAGPRSEGTRDADEAGETRVPGAL
jgi:hypothetical protein